MKESDFMSEVKICSKCKQELPISEFRWRNKAKGVLHSQCKICEKARDKIHYQESKERKNSVRETADFQKSRNLLVVEEARKKGCRKCGEHKTYVLDFHHRVADEKNNDIAHMVKSSSEINLLRELKKCDVLCANCHREFHYLEKLYGITYDEYIYNLYNAEIVQ